jgi:UDP-N-acetylglucosamine--dolichyl-phosphate N-acetylglucosaminephosphotransferase
LVGFGGYMLTELMIPVCAKYTLKAGLSGKDLGKKGTSLENVDVPEALGLVCGFVFLICGIFSQLLFASTQSELIAYNSALFSICFMVFLGFCDDTLNLKWRYKLVLPTIASLPLLVAYTGETALLIPEPLRAALFSGGQLTWLGSLLDQIWVVDVDAQGAIVELGQWFMVFMGFLAVFCTNSINILAGINGLECGQSVVIAAWIFCFKAYDMACVEQMTDSVSTNEVHVRVGRPLFVCVVIIPFAAVSLALLRHNWFPAQVFVGDTFCYFAGMTFAVVGILGHFSKSILLLFLPQVFNFLYSCPQLFKLLPCPRHRLPRVDATSGHLYYSAFPCKPSQYRVWPLKVKAEATEVPNMTLICAILRSLGPIRERNLCLVLLTLQVMSGALAFYVRYILFKESQ